jgi:hypothetical protein
MNKKTAGRIYREFLLAAPRLLAGITARFVRRRPNLCSPTQPDGWKAEPIVIVRRFTHDADLDSGVRTPVGDEGYYLYILNESADWDHSDPTSITFSIWQRPWAHSWLMLESPADRLECGHTGDSGLTRPRFHDGVFQRIQEGHPDPIGYLWETMSDGRLQIGKPNRPPTFVWRMPITSRKYQLIHEYVMQRKYDKFGVRTHNCTDMVIEAAALAGINLIHRIRLTLPPETKIWGRMRRLWTNPEYRLLEYGTPEVLEVDLRQLARLGIGSDATKWYLGLKS